MANFACEKTESLGSATIPGTRSEARLAENVAAADVELTDEDLARVREILPEGSHGHRYPAQMMPDA
jgi:aryl-alcohol dehydrogenase-like predicted oxidoreductase